LQPDALLEQAMTASDNERRTPVVPGCAIEEMLGRGGMGVVFRARQTALDRMVAVKVLAVETAGDPQFIERLEREARTMARLRHPNVVAVHDFQFLDDGSAAIVMEFVGGGSLREVLARHRQGLPVGEALRIFHEVAAGLHAAHEAGVVHRDMKPENVLIEPDGTARVTDFGLALPLDLPEARLTRVGTTVGTVEYMAPEQSAGHALDERADIYSLGAMLYELLTGHAPRGSFDPPHLARTGVPVPVSMATMRALRPDPAKRFESIAAFERALALAPPAPRWRVGLLIAVIAGLLAVVGAIYRPSGHQPPPAAPVPRPWRDALAGIDINRDNYGGDWQRDGTALVSGNGICVFALERSLPASFDARMTFTRLAGVDSIALFVAANDSVGSCELDAWREHLCGVQAIGREDLRDGYGFRFAPENGRTCELFVEVRPGVIRMQVDGGEVHAFEIGAQKLQPPEPWNWRPAERPAALAIGSWQGPTRFEKVEWREVRNPDQR
jgi:predicted Ser/Thr protein kinase